MLTFQPDGIEDFAARHTEPVPPLLDKLREETYATMEAPGMQVGRIEGAFLRILVRMLQAKRILEIGMFTGYSALSMAEALREGGELITCDVNPKAEEVARRYFAQSPHGKKIHVRMGPALETIKTLKGPFDLVFIDADKENYPAYYDAVFPLVRQGGAIVGDNTLWSGKVLAPKAESDKAIVAYDDKVANDPRVDKVLLTVRDGILIAVKR